MKRIICIAALANVLMLSCAEEDLDGAIFVAEGRQPAWGPEGLICYVYEGALWTYDVNGGQKTKLTPEGQWSQAPDWRHDGREIVYHGAFKEQGDETKGLYIIPKEGGEPRFLLKGDFETPTWSPDSKYVAAVSRWGIEREPGLIKINVETLETIKLPSRGTPYNPDWSPGGEWITFAQAPYESETVPEGGLWAVSADGKDVRRLTATAGADDPCWNSRGSVIAYGVTNGGIYTLDLKMAIVKRVTAFKSYEPTWAPDGHAIAFTSALNGETESIYITYP